VSDLSGAASPLFERVADQPHLAFESSTSVADRVEKRVEGSGEFLLHLDVADGPAAIPILEVRHLIRVGIERIVLSGCSVNADRRASRRDHPRAAKLLRQDAKRQVERFLRTAIRFVPVHGLECLARVSLTPLVSQDEKYEGLLREFLFADWQNYATTENAQRVRERLQSLFELIHGKAKIEGDWLFQHGGQIGSSKRLR